MKVSKSFLILSLILFFYFVIHFVSASALKQVEVTGVFPKPGILKIYIAKTTHGFNEHGFGVISFEGSLDSQTIIIPMSNVVAHKMRIEFADSVLAANVKKIKLSSHFQSSPMEIFMPDTKHFLQDNVIEINKVNIGKHPFVHYALPLMLGVLVFLFIDSIQWRNFPVIVDLFNNQKARNSDNLQALDGLRGVAALTVLLEHTMGEFIGLGRAGVWLFFTLSGFLLVKSFVLYPESTFTKEGLRNYFTKRLRRILPMFYVMITVVYLLGGKTLDAMRHYLLIQGDGHYWTILHELYFYLLLPFIALISYRFFKQKYLLIAVFLFCLALLWHYYGSVNILSIYGLGLQHTAYFHVFLMGMIAGYIYFGKFYQLNGLQMFIKQYNNWLSAIALIILLVFFFYSSDLRIVEEKFTIFNAPFLSSIITACLVLLSAICTHSSIYGRFLSFNVLRLVGIVGFSFYLIHPYTIRVWINIFEFFFAVAPHSVLPSFVTTIGAFLLTLPFAMLSYSYIERPFLNNQKSNNLN